MNYNEILTNDQKINILQNRLSQLVIEGYQNSIGMKTAVRLGDQEKIDQMQNILNVIEQSIIVHKEELDSLTAEKSE